jgi:hypothetical protein
MPIPNYIDILTGNLELLDETPTEIYLDLISDYGQAIASNVWKMASVETGHFKSHGWSSLFNQGMESFGAAYPYGWTAMQPFWDDCTDYAPIGPHTMKNATTGEQTSWLEFPTPEAALYTLAEWLKLNNNDPTKWDPGESDYLSKVNSVSLPNQT